MHSSTALGIFASLYRRCDKEDWIDATEHDTWQDFLKTVCPTIEIISLPDDLSADDQNNEVVRDTNQLDTKSYHELKKIPSYEKFITFANQHYIGGLPTSIVAVESLFRTWSASCDSQVAFAKQTGLYNSDYADHMRYLFEAYNIQIPYKTLPPDHLSNLLIFLSLLVENASLSDVCTFIDEHLDWLPAYLERINERADKAIWLISLTQVLIKYLTCIKETTS